MRVKGVIIGILLVIISVVLILQLKHNAFNIKTFEIDKIKFFMTKKEVERLYGNGSDNSEGCMGCSMYFDYPELKISGSYSETLDRMDENGEMDFSKSPKLTELTIYKDNFSIMGIQIGSTFENARQILEQNGYKLQSDENKYFYNYYYRGDIFIKLRSENGFIGKDEDIVSSISIEFRVMEDLGIVY